MNVNLSIIIVNYRSAPLLINCVDSILRFHADNRPEFIIVDNHSCDGSKHTISDENVFPLNHYFPEVERNCWQTNQNDKNNFLKNTIFHFVNFMW
jgi:GT2 family glycosyltransferase